MAKLSQDEIKWVLSIDAKGIHKEIAVVSSEINRLAQANKTMTSDMKAAEKQLKTATLEMEKLAKAGKEDTDAYRELSATAASARADIDSYTVKIGQNSRAITENKKKLEEMEKSMSINEMTMRQLRARAAELQKQLNATSAAANPKEYKTLQKELTQVNNRIFDVQNQGKGLIHQFAAMNNPVGSAAQSVIGFGQALKVLIANPVGIVIMAIVAAFHALKIAIAGSDEASTKFSGVMAALNSVLDAGKRLLTETISLLLNLATFNFEGIKENINNMADIGSTLVENAEAAYEAAIAEDALNDSIARNNDITEVNKARIAELRQITKDSTKSLDERKKASNELIELEKENYKMAVSNISGQYEVWKGKNKNLIDAMKRGSLAQFTEVEKYMSLVQSGTELTYQQRIELARLVNDITTTLDRGTEEEKEKFRSFFSELSTMQQEYFDGNRRDVVADAKIEEDVRREAQQAAKEAIERKIAAVDYALKEETKLLKQQLVDRSITQKEYDRELEQKTIEALQKKLQIAGLEKDARMDIEQQILDFKIKAVELEKQLEKERADMAKSIRVSFMDKDNQELESIREKYNKRNEELRAALKKEAITELEYNEYKATLLQKQENELDEKRKTQNEAKAAQKLVEQNKKYEAEKIQLMERYALGLTDRQAYDDALLELDRRYATQSLVISNLSDKEKMAARKKLLDYMVKQQNEETKKQEEEQKKRKELYSQFSEQIGTVLGGVISGNEDMVKSSLKAILNMALDALEAQVTMSIASATAQSFAQADSVTTFGASGAARALILTALIKAAFAGVKAIVNSAMSGSSKSSSSTATPSVTGSRVVSGRQSGGFIDVSREQDGRRYKAILQPRRRGFIDRPTVLVGEGPSGKSMEWVASNDALQNPTIAPLINLLNEAQQAGNIRTIDLSHLMRARMAGFSSGGFINQQDHVAKAESELSPSLEPSNMSVLPLLSDLKNLLQHLKTNGLKSSVVLSELQRQEELMKTSRKIGSKQ